MEGFRTCIYRYKEGSQNMNKKPLASICCITYNHKPYIAKAIEGFLMQKTNFSFEILIHDYASTDGTNGIIDEAGKLISNSILTDNLKRD